MSKLQIPIYIGVLTMRVHYRISSYKAFPPIILAFIIMPAPDTLLCRWNLVISNNNAVEDPYEKIISLGLI